MLYEFTVPCLECEGEGKIYRGGEGGDYIRECECEYCNSEGVTYCQAYYETTEDLEEDFPDAENIEKHTLTEYEKYWLKHNPEVLKYDNVERHY